MPACGPSRRSSLISATSALFNPSSAMIFCERPVSYRHAPFPIVERNTAPRFYQGRYFDAEVYSLSSLKFPFMPLLYPVSSWPG